MRKLDKWEKTGIVIFVLLLATGVHFAIGHSFEPYSVVVASSPPCNNQLWNVTVVFHHQVLGKADKVVYLTVYEGYRPGGGYAAGRYTRLTTYDTVTDANGVAHFSISPEIYESKTVVQPVLLYAQQGDVLLSTIELDTIYVNDGSFFISYYC